MGTRMDACVRVWVRVCGCVCSCGGERVCEVYVRACVGAHIGV